MSAILRRAEFKRKRRYRRRARQRHPIERALREALHAAYASVCRNMFPMITPLIDCLKRGDNSDASGYHEPRRWGGSGLHFDVIIAPQCPSPADDYAGHVARGKSTSDGTDAAPVHYGEPARAPLSGARE